MGFSSVDDDGSAITGLNQGTVAAEKRPNGRAPVASNRAIHNDGVGACTEHRNAAFLAHMPSSWLQDVTGHFAWYDPGGWERQGARSDQVPLRSRGKQTRRECGAGTRQSRPSRKSRKSTSVCKRASLPPSDHDKKVVARHLQRSHQPPPLAFALAARWHMFVDLSSLCALASPLDRHT